MKLKSVALTTSLSPVLCGALAALAAREDPGKARANVVLARLVREELDRLAPGLWDELVYRQSLTDVDDVGAAEASRTIAELVAARLRARATL
jgi:hypothetical protein